MIEVYRLTLAKYAGDLSGEGARLYGGRWNTRGIPALYAASSVPLAMLENLVHVGAPEDLPESYTVTVIRIEESISHRETEVPARRQDSQSIGSKLLANENTLGFWAPSVVVDGEFNIVLNPGCARFLEAVRVVRQYEQRVDRRLGW